MTDAADQLPSTPRPAHGYAGSRWFLALAYLFPIVFYTWGLTRDLHEPWIGMHDWNGAFFSQLARNLTRYPFEFHHGMSVVASGPHAPPEERSIYATHPPGLIWLVGAAFTLGESEAAARAVPIAASIISLLLLMWLVRRAFDDATAVLAGVVYACMPMAVFFGRMVDHEAVCLMFMLLAMSGLCQWIVPAHPRRPRHFRRATVRRMGAAIWPAAMLAGCLVDWSVVLFCGIVCVWALFRRRLIGMRRLTWIAGVSAMSVALTTTYLVYAGLAGRWADLLAIFFSRSAEEAGAVLRREGGADAGVNRFIVENLSMPTVCLAALGLAAILLGRAFHPAAGRLSRGRVIARDAQWLIFATGVLWVAVFWRQFERHNYWMFYVGPAAAVFAARFIELVHRVLAQTHVGIARGAAAVLIGACLVYGVIGTQAYFERLSRPPVEPAAWTWIRARTAPGERVLLMRNPYREELRGTYLFRNVIPPHMAWYLDRRLGVEPNPAHVPQRAADFAVYVVEWGDFISRSEELSVLRPIFPLAEGIEGFLAVVDLRTRTSRPGDAAAPAAP